MEAKTKLRIKYERCPGQTKDDIRVVCYTNDWQNRPADVVQQAAGLCGYGDMVELHTSMNNARRYDCDDIRVIVLAEPC